MKENKGNSKNRYRMPDHTAKKLGLEVNKSGRYRLTENQKRQFFGLDMHQIKRLFFDIETSPMIAYTWRVGYKINLDYENIVQDWRIICICYKWEGEEKVHELRWDKNQCDKKMLQKFVQVLNEADEISAHNGDRFDIKKIRTRCVFHRIPIRPKYRSFDTLKKARSSFNFNSNRLDYIAQFLGVGAKLKHEGFPMWVKCLEGDKKALDDMVEYCIMDIIVLEDVYLALQNYTLNNTHAGTHNGGLKCSCPNCGSEDINLLKNVYTAKGTIKRLIGCNTCGYEYETSNSAYRTYLELRKSEI